MMPALRSKRNLCLSKIYTVLFCLLATTSILAAQGLSTSGAQSSDPKDTPTSVVTQPITPQAAYQAAHPKSVPMPSQQGQVVFRNPNGSRTAIVGGITHQDLTDGSWKDNAPVLSQTANGWRLDGGAQSLFIRGNGLASHTLTTTFTDFNTKHGSVLALTFPPLTYDKALNYHFSMSGLTWTLTLNTDGTFQFSTVVAKRLGPKAYTFPVSSSEKLTVNSAGQLIGDTHVGLTRAMMIPKFGKAVPCSAWVYSASVGAIFTCDDSSLKDNQLPYRIDPSSQLSDPSGGTYHLTAWAGWSWDDGCSCWNYIQDAGSAQLYFNTNGIVPSNANFNGMSCSFHTIDMNGSDSPNCNMPDSYNNNGTTRVLIQIGASWPDEGSCCDAPTLDESADVNNVTLTVTWTGPPGAPSLNSPSFNSTNQPLNPTLSWSAASDANSYDVYLDTVNPPQRQVSSGGSNTSFTPSTPLNAATKYYWAVNAVNGYGSTSSGTSQFTTNANGPYSYFYTDTLTSINTSLWTQLTNVQTSSAGLSSGSVRFYTGFQDGSGNGEVKATAHLTQSGGTYSVYARMNADASSYYGLDMQNPTWSNGICTTSFVLYKVVNRVTTVLASEAGMACYASTDMRIAVRSGIIMGWFNQFEPAVVYDSSLSGGNPGVGASNTPSGNTVSQVQLGRLDTTPPYTVNASSVVASLTPNRVDLQWQAVTDDQPDGVGLQGYVIYRILNGNSVAIDWSPIPSATDETASPGTTYTYTITPYDQHDNYGTATSITVTTPTAGNIDPRRTGVRANGSYWGAAGEQIDMLSGNLNFTLPLLKPVARGGWSLPIALSYNSQMWRQDGGGQSLLGRDVGYGLGWQLMAGSLRAVYAGYWGLDHYVFTDATGAEYILDQNNNGIWTTSHGLYIAYDYTYSRIHFPDGSTWLMTSQSGGAEQDAGTCYPSVIQDANGNQIQFTYAPAIGTSTPNTSARIAMIVDERHGIYQGKLGSYFLTYTTFPGDTIPHLTSIINEISTPESYTFGYLTNRSITSPFASGQSFGTATLLQSVTVSGLNISTSFAYGQGSGNGTFTAEMTQMTTPLGGILSWTYRTYTYSSGTRSYREVQTRSMQPLSGGTTYSWSFANDPNGASMHTWATVTDNGTSTSKYWAFANGTGAFQQFPSSYEDRNSSGTAVSRKTYAWTQGPPVYSGGAGNAYVSSVTTTLDPTTSPATTISTQTLDAWGNITQSTVSDYSNPNTPSRTYNFSYVNDSNYTSRYLMNLLTTATVTGTTGGPVTLVSNSYDGAQCGALQDPGNLDLHDSSYGTSFTYRGNLTQTSHLGDTTCYAYQITGFKYLAQDGAGHSVSLTASSATNGSLPGVITPGGNGNLATSVSYASSFAVTQVISPNGATTTTNYDGYGRPQNSTVADGQITDYTYTYNPNVQTATLRNLNQWTKTTLDGFGRVIQVQNGHDTTTVNQTDTVYAPCACSPLGKVSQVSQPYAPGATRYWTTYTYDAMGRTTAITKPDSSSTTTYAYLGNTTTTTDPAGKWKRQTVDGSGNLITVTEPDPAYPTTAIYVTSYTYNVVNQLTQVSMPRPTSSGTYTQTRTFVYTGQDMTSTTNPENGTVTYLYDGAHHVTRRTDNIGNQTNYTYDTYGRLTAVNHLAMSTCGTPPSPCLVAQPMQNVTYYWDTNPLDSTGYSTNTWGRVAAVGFAIEHNEGNFSGRGMAYMYNYTGSGHLAGQRLQVGPPLSSQTPANLDTTYWYDSLGRTLGIWYPLHGTYDGHTAPTYSYSYDSMGRLSQVTVPGGSAAAVATYTAAGQLSTLTMGSLVETRTYDPAMMQLTRMTTVNSGTTVMDMQYTFPSGQNNGRISQAKDWVLGQTTNYTYDALRRLSTASIVETGTGEQMSYDGFGNLTGMNGAAVWTHDPSTNRVSTTGWSYDGNGNVLADGNGTYTWDIENRMLNGTSNSYDPNGRLIQDAGGTFYVYSQTGQRIATYTVSWDSNGNPTAEQTSSRAYFKGRILGVAQDRALSVRWAPYASPMSYRSYGAEQTSTNSGWETFATYPKVSPTAYYADQRFYNSQMGKFFSPDSAVGRSGVPLSWNRYSYTNGDPINFNDPRGRMACSLDGVSIGCDVVLPDCGNMEFAIYQQTSPGPRPCLQYGYNSGAEGFGAGGGGGSDTSAAPNPPPEPAPAPTGFSLVDTKACVGTSGATGGFGLFVTYQLMVDGRPVYGNQRMATLGINYIGEQLTNLSGNMNTNPDSFGKWCRADLGPGVCAPGQIGSLTANGTFTDEYSGMGTEDQSYYLNGTGPALSVLFPLPQGSSGPALQTSVLSNVLNSSPGKGQSPYVSVAGEITGTPASPKCR